MSARVRWPISSVAFVSALLLSTFGACPWAGVAVAAECLTEPGSSASPDSHWYYRIDRVTQRKCWHLRAANEPPQQGVSKTAQVAPAANEHSFDNFKDFIAQRSNATLSDADIKSLYAQFLEWRRKGYQ
jgi:hypothetical protein